MGKEEKGQQLHKIYGHGITTFIIKTRPNSSKADTEIKPHGTTGPEAERPPNPKACPADSSFYWESHPDYLGSIKASSEPFFLSYLRPKHEMTKEFLMSHGTSKSKLGSLNDFSQGKGNISSPCQVLEAAPDTSLNIQNVKRFKFRFIEGPGNGYFKVMPVTLKFLQVRISLCWQVTKRNKHSSINSCSLAHKKRPTYNRAGILTLPLWV